MSQEDEARTRRRLIEEFWPDGPVMTGPVVSAVIVDQPVSGVLLQHATPDGESLMRVFLTLEGFRQYADWIVQIALDAGCYQLDDSAILTTSTAEEGGGPSQPSM